MLRVNKYQNESLNAMMRKTAFPENTLRKFVWSGPSRTSDIDSCNADVLRSLERMVRAYVKFPVDYEERNERLGALIQEIIKEELATDTWERDVLADIGRVQMMLNQSVIGEREHFSTLQEVWPCFEELRSKIERIKQQKFETPLESYQNRLEHFEANAAENNERTPMEKRILSLKIELCQMKVAMFNTWKSIESKKMVIEGLLAFKKTAVREKMIWDRVLRVPCERLFQGPLARHETYPISGIYAKYTGFKLKRESL